VREAFAANFRRGREVGAALAVVHDGETVVDLWAGWADQARSKPLPRDPIPNRNPCPKARGAPRSPPKAVARWATNGQGDIASCAPGFKDCDGNIANGCEVQTDFDPLNCGRCGGRGCSVRERPTRCRS